MTSPWHLRPLVTQGDTSCGERRENRAVNHCTSCVVFDSYFKLCASSPSVSTQSSGRSSLNWLQRLLMRAHPRPRLH
eukprot:12946701-Alexandrium_andersonii.AAC.1